MWLIKRTMFQEMVRDSFTRFFWIGGTLCITGAVLLLSYLVFPAFSLELTLHKEQDAVLLTRHLVCELDLNHGTLTQSYFTPAVRKRIATLADDFKLYKIRIFDAAGTIIYSSIAAEVGAKNTYEYFKEIIAKGNPRSKLTRRDDRSLEGQHLLRDVVETYVPIMNGKKFVGAVEYYIDVTDTYHSIDQLIGYMKTVAISIAVLLFCGLTVHLLAHAKQHLERQKHQLLAEEMDQIMRHDLKAPISTLIHGFDFMLMDTALRPNDELIHELKKVAYRMLHAINSSLTLGKIERGGYVISREPVDIAALLAAIKDDMHQLIQNKELDVIVRQKRPHEVFYIPGDHALLYSTLANLLKNAIEASPKNKEIIIALSTHNGSKTIAITNDGVVPPPIRENFFDKFVTSNKLGGTGFGTYGAKLMTEIQEGSIRLECNDDAHTTTLYLAFAAQ